MTVSSARLAGGPAPHPSPGSPTLDQIMEATIDLAPEALSRRVLLQSIDWSGIGASRVAEMVDGLARRQLSLPRALANALLVAGHVLPTEMMQTAGQRALNALNGNDAGTRADMLAASLPSLAEPANVDPEIGRAIIGHMATSGEPADACRMALTFWCHVPQALGPVRAQLASYLATMPPLQIRLAGFSTTDTFAADLGPAFGMVGRNALITQAEFGGALATLLRPDAEAAAHMILLDFDGFAGPDWRLPTPKIWELLVERGDLFGEALSTFATRTSSTLLINSIPVPAAPTAGLLDSRHVSGLRNAVQLINRRLLEAAERHSNIVVVDADQALVDLAPSRHRDPKLWFYGRVAYSADATRALACAFAKAWSLSVGGPAKVLALDLDNTLWGGTYGDDGLEHLTCGEEFPGNAFQAFQQECLRLKHQGLLLVALSKNNPDAITVFERHAGMVLKGNDFAASAVNWQPKPDNIRKIAREFSLGLDSFVFIDDSPHEREAMRRLAPEVIVPELPEDPAQRPGWLRRLTCTWPVRLTEEDGRRSEMYAADRGARALKASTASVEDYLAGLQQQLTVRSADRDAIARVAQMHQRTNQFNLTTRRLTEAEIAAYVDHPGRGLALLGRVVDKFGDHGVVIAATVAIEGARAEINTFLMSCRVIGREIERAFLAALLALLAKRGVKRVIGRFLATAKNDMVLDFYPASGFVRVESSEGDSTWVFDTSTQQLRGSQFVSVIVEA